MGFSDQDWDKIEHIYDICMGTPHEEWDRLISIAGITDKTLIEKAKRLILNSPKAEQFFDSIGRRLQNDLSSGKKSKPLDNGTIIDKFRIVRTISTGKESNVYLAQRADGRFRQNVALKIMHSPHPGSIKKSGLSNEQQILASLIHPNIARLYDGGLTGEGNPYMVMEYIDGVPFDIYCKKHCPALYYRLKLFSDLCDAVQHAHNQSIIHRDIKPGNILVDKDRQLKLVDFGISACEGNNRSRKRDIYHFAGTPGYASPEQLNGDPATSQSDIFQMGKVFCKILTGTHDLQVENDHQETGNGLKQFRRDFTSHNGKEYPMIIIRDLFAIISRATAPDSRKRYLSASEIKTDIENLINCYPLLAGNYNTYNRLNKFIRRNRFPVILVAIIITLIPAMFLLSNHESAGSSNAYDNSNQNGSHADKRDQARLLFNTGEYFQALEMYQLIMENDTSLLGNTHPNIANNHINIAVTRMALGHLDKCLFHLDSALGILKKSYGAENLLTTQILALKGDTYMQMKDSLSAAINYSTAHQISCRLLGHSHPFSLDYSARINKTGIQLPGDQPTASQ